MNKNMAGIHQIHQYDSVNSDGIFPNNLGIN